MADDIEEKHVRQTIGFRVAKAERKEKDTAFIMKEVLQEVCGVSVADILCLQDLPAQGIYDVTFCDEPVCARALKRLKAAGDGEPLGGIEFSLGSVSREVPITVHMYNPFCSVEAVGTFLHVYCDKVWKVVKLCDHRNYWNGRRRFAAILEADVEGIGGTRHPPAVFNVGSHIGFLYYPGQPKFCSTCSSFGHFSPDCPQYEGDDGDDATGWPYPSRLQVEQHWRDYAENPEQEHVLVEYRDADDLEGAK